MSENADDKTSPAHYTRLTPEPIAVIEHWGLGFNLGNAVKYISRAGHKPGADVHEDLAKARWYLDRELRNGAGSSVSCAETEMLESELEHAQAEAKRWRTIAHVVAAHLRAIQTSTLDALADYSTTCVESGGGPR